MPSRNKQKINLLDRILGGLGGVIVGVILGMAIVAATNFSVSIFWVFAIILLAITCSLILGILKPQLTGQWLCFPTLFLNDYVDEIDFPEAKISFAFFAAILGIFAMLYAVFALSQTIFFAGFALAIPFAILSPRAFR